MKNKNDIPLISVIILSYNHEVYIEKCIRSIFLQTINHPNIEIIITDDGSTDNTINILEKLSLGSPIPMRINKKEHIGVTGIAKNMNELIRMSKGKYIACLASDDEYTPDRFRLQLKLLDADDSIKLVYGNGINVKNNNILGPVINEEISDILIKNNASDVFEYITTNTSPLYIQSVLISRNFLIDFSPYDENLIADDWVFNLRVFEKLLADNYQYSYIDKPLFLRNIHESNTSSNSDVHFLRILQVIQKYIPAAKKKFMYKKLYKTFMMRYFREAQLRKGLNFFFQYIYIQIKR